MFNSKQIEYMKSLGLNFDFDVLSDDELAEIEETVGEALQKSGFDKDYKATKEGKMCESILDQLA